MAFISSSPPPMMPDDEDIEDIDEFGGHLDDDEDEDSAAFDLTGKSYNVNFDTKSAFVYFQACLQNSKAFPKKPYRWLPRKLSCQPMDLYLWKTP